MNYEEKLKLIYYGRAKIHRKYSIDPSSEDQNETQKVNKKSSTKSQHIRKSAKNNKQAMARNLSYQEKIDAIYALRKRIKFRDLSAAIGFPKDSHKQEEFHRKFQTATVGSWKGNLNEEGWDEILNKDGKQTTKSVSDEIDAPAQKLEVNFKKRSVHSRAKIDKDTVIALYGNEKLLKGYCKNCKTRVKIIHKHIVLYKI